MRVVIESLYAIVVCCVTFAIVNFVHSQFFPVHVILYDALLDVVISIAAAAALVWFWRRSKTALTSLETFQAIIIGGLICTLYAFVGPTIIDRSLSIYILEKLDQRGGGIRADAMPGVFVNEYMPEYRLTDIRITEQLNSGTIKIKDDCIYLTPRGREIVAFTHFYRAHILPKKREIMGKYTDELTDPFRNSVKDVDYKCTPPTN